MKSTDGKAPKIVIRTKNFFIIVIEKIGTQPPNQKTLCT